MAIILTIFTVQIHCKRKTRQYRKRSDRKTQELALVLISKHLIDWSIFELSLVGTSQFYWEKVASQSPQHSKAVSEQLNEKTKYKVLKPYAT